MSYREIQMGEQIVPMRTSALTPYLYRNIFHKDIMKDLNRKSQNARNSFKKDKNIDIENHSVNEAVSDESIDSSYKLIELASEIGYVMAIQASNEITPQTQNVNSYYKWLDSFENGAFEFAFGEIIDLYLESSNKQSELKKKQNQ